MAQPPTQKTCERILDAAEQLFAEHGIRATSLRAITREADVNLAAVHYHFGSKEGLLDAVIERQAQVVNESRLDELARLEQQAGGEGPTPEALLAAFILPAVSRLRDLGPRGQHLPQLLARIEAQPADVVEELLRKHFGEVARRFVEALTRALPEHTAETIAERLRFTAALIAHLFSGNFHLDVIPGHPPSSRNPLEQIEHALYFLAAGLRAPDPRRLSGPCAENPRRQSRGAA
jgi:AcrR family transcriptional regulator